MTMVGWPLAGDRGDSEKVVGGHWQKTGETVKKWWDGHKQKTEETVNKWWVVTGRRQRRQ